MKRNMALIAVIFLSHTLLAQPAPRDQQPGIRFYRGAWKEALAKAKEENKLIFVDVYTSWCGPCKRMAAEVFPQEKVGDIFNTSFVNYSIDAEKGEGIAIAKKFGVHAFPTYLFVNGDGQLIYRSGSYMDADQFLKVAADAIKEKNDPVPFAQWEDKYNAGDRDKVFLTGYLKKRATLGMPSAGIIDQVVPLLKPGELNDSAFLSNVVYFNPNIEYIPGGKFYQYIAGHAEEVDSILGKSNNFSLKIMQMGLRNYFRKNIIAHGRKKMLPVMVAANKQLSHLLDLNDGAVTSKAIVMDYYSGTHDTTNLIAAARDYVYNGLLKEDIRAKTDADKAGFKKWMQPYLSGEKDSSQLERWTAMKRLNAHNRMINMSYDLRHAAEAIYQNTADKKALQEAAGWAKLADSWFPHFSTEAVYAGLLLKMGRRQEAVDMMIKASRDSFIRGSDKQKMLTANAEEMKKGRTPDQLW